MWWVASQRLQRPPRGRAPGRLLRYESGKPSTRRADPSRRRHNESVSQRVTTLSVIEAGRTRGAESIHFIDVQVALNDFAALG